MVRAVVIGLIATLAYAAASPLNLFSNIGRTSDPEEFEDSFGSEPLPPTPTPYSGPTATSGRGPVLYQPPFDRVSNKLASLGARPCPVPGGIIYFVPMPPVTIQPTPIIIRPAPAKTINPAPIIVRSSKCPPIQPPSFMLRMGRTQPASPYGSCCSDDQISDIGYQDYTR